MIMLCLVEESIGIVDVLSGALQLHAQDILNDIQLVLSAIQLVFTSKWILQRLKDDFEIGSTSLLMDLHDVENIIFGEWLINFGLICVHLN